MKNSLSVETKKLTVSFSGNTVLDNININIKSGEIVAFVGPNGAGKTTLFRAILGILPYKGNVLVFGQPVKKVINRLGYVPQSFNFDKRFPLKVSELLKLSLNKNNSDRDLERVLEEVDMKNNIDKLIGQLSAGQMQRILIARALINQPDILFFDEAIMGVDIEGEKSFYEILKNQNNKGVTVLMITHEINMVYKYATQVVCLNKSLFCYGSPQTSVTAETLNKLYGEDIKFRGHQH